MNEDRILIEVEVDDNDAGKRLSEIKQKMAELQTEQKKLAKEIKSGNDTTGEMAKKFANNEAALSSLKAAEKDYTAVIQQASKANTGYGDSLNSMSAQLAQMKREYRSLSKEAREGEAGQALLKEIGGLDEKLKAADASMGDFQRNVGNYSSALKGLDDRVVQVSGVFEGGFVNGLKTAGNGVKTFSKTLLTTPVGWISVAIQALIGIFNQLKAAFQRNDESSDSLKEAFTALKPAVTVIRTIFDGLAKTIGAVAKGFSAVFTWVAEKVSPAYRQAAKDAYSLEKAQQALDDRNREYTVNAAKRGVQIAKLNSAIRTDETLTAKEREKMAKKAIDIERQDMEERKALAAEALRIYQLQLKEEVSLTDEQETRLAELKAAAYKAEEEYITGTLRLAQQEKSARVEAAKAAQEAAKAKREAAIQAAKVAEEEARKAQDLILELAEDEAGKINVTYQRQIADLKKRLAEEKSLTKEAREAIASQISSLEAKQAKEVSALQEAAAKERQDREVQAYADLNAAKLAAMKDSAAKEAAQSAQSTAAALAALQGRLDNEKDLSAAARAAILEQMELTEEQGQAKIAEIRAKWRAKELQEQWSEVTKKAALLLKEAEAAGASAKDILNLQVSQAQEAYGRLLAIDSETKAAMFANETAYKEAVLDSLNALNAARKAASDSSIQQLNDFKGAVSEAGSSLSSLFGEIAEDEEALAVFNKGIALVNATLALAEAIAKATSAASAGDPYTLAIRVVAAAATVAANFAGVISAIKAATVPSAPSFEKGGIVPGNSLTGDRIKANVNSREMVLTLDDQQRLLGLIRSGVPSGGDDIAAALAKALQGMPAPVLEYRTFRKFAQKAEMQQKSARIR